MKWLGILVTLPVILVTLIFEATLTTAPPRYCPTTCAAKCPLWLGCSRSSQKVQIVCCCTGSQHGETFCCWYRGEGFRCTGSSAWCVKYAEGTCEEFTSDEFGMCARDTYHNLVCSDL